MTHDLLSEALQLPEPERIRLADALYRSCEGDPGHWLDDDQIRTIERRSTEIERGQVNLIDASEVFRRARERLGR